ncbi:hypothetical protein [Homoserinibacter gongjuensis]|uniref:hypothetical protein n=1 Tax=Homoserinibacter gongjuensis TaxID=1162968 RepID=UPI0024E0FDA0|nr:hypothetical protein [Homoserinibacter gongjuensis]
MGDLHEALTAIQQQRILWQRYVAAGVTPEVPTGISDVQVAWQQVSADLAELDAPLGRTTPRRVSHPCRCTSSPTCSRSSPPSPTC